MKGRPQSSPEEREDAIALIRKDTEVAPLLAAGTHIVGGFVVDAPQGQPPQGRYLEFHVAPAATRSTSRRS